MNKRAIKETLKDFIRSISGKADIDDQTNLIESGLVDSVTFIELILFVEKEFDIKYNLFKFQMASFENINALANYILKEQEAAISCPRS